MNPLTPTDKTVSSLRRRWLAGLATFGGLGLFGAGVEAQGWGGRGAVDPEEMGRRIEWRIGRMVQEAGGTPQQKERLVAIARTAMADMKPLREQARAARRQGVDLLGAPVIDRAAIERARAAQMQAVDARSKRMTQAMAEAAEVLTPDQRLKMTEHMRLRMDRGRG